MDAPSRQIYHLRLKAGQELLSGSENWKPSVISARLRMDVAITNVAQSRHMPLQYKGFGGTADLSVYIRL